MRIALVQHRLRKNDGQGRVNLEIARRALERGHRLTLLSEWIEPEFANHAAVQQIKIPYRERYSNLVAGEWFAHQSARWLQKHRHQIDLVLSNGAATRFPADLCACHFVHSAWYQSPVHPRHDGGWTSRYQGTYTRFNSLREKQAYRQAGTVIAVSDQVSNELKAIGVDGNKIVTILNGVNTDEFCPGEESRTALCLPEQCKIALFAGDIRTSRKNLGTVLKAMQQVSDLHLAVAGKLEESPFPALAEKLGLQGRVHFLGFRRDIPRLMRACDLFVFPSRYEACSLVLLEALASGLPVITASTAGGCEIITPDCGRVLPDPDNDVLLAETLNALQADSTCLQKMGKAARQKALQHTWSHMADQYIDLLEMHHSRKAQSVSAA